MRKDDRFRQDRSGSAAVEFAITAMMLITTILFCMTIGVILFLNQALDYATRTASRQIMIGAAKTANWTQAELEANICGALPSVISCADLITNLYIIPPGGSPSSYYNYVKGDQSGLTIPLLSASTGQYAFGNGGEYQYLQVIYPVRFIPKAFAAILSGGVLYQGSAAYLIVSTAAFRNERF